jgi:hypothetical protein
MTALGQTHPRPRSNKGHPMLPSRRQLASYPVINRRMIAETGQIPLGYHMIRDVFPFKVLDTKMTVTEGVDGRETPVMRVSGLFQMGDNPNANGRIYPTSDVLAPAVRAIQEDISHRKVMGEYDHPADAKIHLDRVSHLITKIWMDGRKVYGEAEVLHRLPCGAALRGLFEHKVETGISSRGVGDMEVVEHNNQELYRVMPGYAFVTWDAVAEPSVSGAVLNIQEGLNKRLRPLQKQRGAFEPKLYQEMLVREIDSFFGTKRKKNY